jgi:hypothetical protein
MSYPLNECRITLVRETGLEPVSLAAADFKSAVYTIPPLSHSQPLLYLNNELKSTLIYGAQDRIRTDTILLLRETPHTNWATWAK